LSHACLDRVCGFNLRSNCPRRPSSSARRMRSSGVLAAGWRANGALALGCLAVMMVFMAVR
jgi:hypothetical protein